MYYTLYVFLTIIIIIIDIVIIIIITIIIIVVVVVVVVISQLRQAAIIKRALIGLSYVARANHRPRERHTRRGRGGLLSFCLLVRPRHFFFRSHKKAMIAMMRGTTPEPLCARQSMERTWRGRTRSAKGGGINVINVRSCYTGSSNELEDAQEQAPTQVPNQDKFFDP